MKLDQIDIIILNMIMQDARTPFKDIAEACHLSRAAVHQRVQRMIGKGIITGSGYKIDLSKLGYKTYSYVGLLLENSKYYQKVEEELMKIPEIVECTYTTGTFALIVKIYAKDNAHLMEILMEKIHKIEGISSSETMVVLKSSFERPFSLPDLTE